jgi:hypothetical protein
MAPGELAHFGWVDLSELGLAIVRGRVCGGAEWRVVLYGELTNELGRWRVVGHDLSHIGRYFSHFQLTQFSRRQLALLLMG